MLLAIAFAKSSLGDFNVEIDLEMARLEGDEQKLNAHQQSLLNSSYPIVALRAVIAQATAYLEDHLFDQILLNQVDKASHLLQYVNLPQEQSLRQFAMVSIAAIQHTLAFLKGDHESARSISESLAQTSHAHDPIVEWFFLKQRLKWDDHLERIEDEIERVAQLQTNPIQTHLLQLSCAEYLWLVDVEQSMNYFSQLPKPSVLPFEGIHAAKYSGRWWYLHSKFESSSVGALKEALTWFRKAGYLNAAKQLLRMLHRRL